MDDQTKLIILIAACQSAEWAAVVGGFPVKILEGLLKSLKGIREARKGSVL